MMLSKALNQSRLPVYSSIFLHSDTSVPLRDHTSLRSIFVDEIVSMSIYFKFSD